MDKDLVIKKSKISGHGVFAGRSFKKGETVIKWLMDKILTAEEAKSFSAKRKKYLVKSGRKFILMQAPAKFVNHSCEANTRVRNNCDVAIRDIKKGEEITSTYVAGSDEFICKCKSKKCKKIIKN